ncbi:hypothetical protein PoB_001793800 [Plakobranchus ocellatus]|uniref:CCHC-type domain-containing protein n=1 Tax=Plakobranchus ocellatus TaxID=259542 RepID=A0AAV3ZAF1_9GAST|nr:hypothetical protein PoB_001793800 [Plakobranchus ocellatus]
MYSSCSDELATHLKDRKPTSLEHMKDLANAFTEARPHVHLSMKKPTVGDTFTSAVGVGRSSRPLQKNSDNSRSASNSRANMQCYRCGKYGHIKKQCRVPGHALKPPATKPRRERVLLMFRVRTATRPVSLIFKTSRVALENSAMLLSRPRSTRERTQLR